MTKELKKSAWFAKFENDWIYLGDSIVGVTNYWNTNQESIEGEPAFFKCQLMTQQEIDELPESDL